VGIKARAELPSTAGAKEMTLERRTAVYINSK